MSTHPIRFGLQTGQQNVEWTSLVDVWRGADEWGYDSMWNYDHFYPIFTDPTGPCFEGWTTLAALAQVTERVRVGSLVNGNTYRNPCVLAKMATSLDHISGGRLNLGIGAGWFEQEHQSFGIDFKTVRGRLEALGESCRIVKGMLGGESVTLNGTHYDVKDAICRPAPVQSGIPMMMGGEGKKIMLGIVARYADMWNAAGTPDKFRELIDVIAGHCEKVSRDPATIEKTVMMPLCYTEDIDRQNMMVGLVAATFGNSEKDARAGMMVGGKDECLEKIDSFVRAGVTHFIFMLFPPYQMEELEGYAKEVMPLARRAHG